MKLDRLMSGVLAAAAVALACGCNSTASLAAPAPRTAQNSVSQQQAVDPNVSGTTSLMSAELSGPAPKVGVGKAHLADDDDQLDAPKEARRSDGSRRGGGFGSSK